jgi:TolB protein
MMKTIFAQKLSDKRREHSPHFFQFTGKKTLTLLAAGSIFVAACLSVIRPAHTIEIDITRGSIQPIPIAIPFFLGGSQQEQQLASEITKVIVNDLEGSGLFIPQDRSAFIEKISSVDSPPRFGDWRIINTQALVVGQVALRGDGKVNAQYRLWDIFSGKQIAGQQFSTGSGNWRRVGHIIADAIYTRLTGEQGYFDTRIAFIDETGPKDARVKRLAIMDQDGYNVRLLTRGKELVLTPRFSPTSQEITYMSYYGGSPRVYRLDIENGGREVVGDFPGMTFAPRFSPDGHSIVMSYQQEGSSNIFIMDLASRQITQLTNTPAIDTGPCFSPDGRQIVFESDRDGGQQLFVMNSDGSNQKRISFGEGRYSTPVWSPRGDLIAFTKLYAGRFLIGVMHPNGKGERILSDGFHNEGPTWAPNGRVLMFFRESPGPTGGPRLVTVDLTGYNERYVSTPSFGSDPAWSPPMK